MTLLFVRRRNLGRASGRGVRHSMEHPSATWKSWQNRFFPPGIDLTQVRYVMRWGCTSHLPLRLPDHISILNQSGAIHRVNNKMQFALSMTSMPSVMSLTTIGGYGTEVPQGLDGNWVLRPSSHAQGRSLWVCSGTEGLRSKLESTGLQATGWYARPLIPKAREVRVYVLQGRVVCVAEKIPEDREAVAWNHARGATFVNLRWGDWPLDACREAVNVFPHTGLHFAGVDLMQHRDTGVWYTIEVNSAPSMPPNEDGSPSYRQRCLAKGLDYHMRKGLDICPEDVVEEEGWREYIHPGVWSRSIQSDTPVFRTTRIQ